MLHALNKFAGQVLEEGKAAIKVVDASASGKAVMDAAFQASLERYSRDTFDADGIIATQFSEFVGLPASECVGDPGESTAFGLLSDALASFGDGSFAGCRMTTPTTTLTTTPTTSTTQTSTRTSTPTTTTTLTTTESSTPTTSQTSTPVYGRMTCVGEPDADVRLITPTSTHDGLCLQQASMLNTIYSTCTDDGSAAPAVTCKEVYFNDGTSVDVLQASECAA